MAILFASSDSVQAQNVILYQAIDGGGRSLPFEEGKVAEMGRGWNDVVSSIWVRDGYQFEGYEAIDFQGAKCYIVVPANEQAPEVSHDGFTYRRVSGDWLVNIHKHGWNDVRSSYKVNRLR